MAAVRGLAAFTERAVLDVLVAHSMYKYTTKGGEMLA